MGLQNINKRRERRQVKNEGEKTASQLWREYLQIREARRNLGVIELEEPYKRGYDRFFVLTELTLKDPNAAEIENILEKYVQNKEWSRNKAFKYRDRRTGKSEPVPHHLKFIATKTIYDIPEKLRHYFTIEWYGATPRYGKWIYRFRFPGMFKSKTEPHIVTHVRILDETLESRYQELLNKIYGEDYQWPKIASALDISAGYRDWSYSNHDLIRFTNSLKEE